MQADTFTCPHCATPYPVKPVLIGRVVRCTGCRQPFCLQADGTARKADEAELAAAEAQRGGFNAASSSTEAEYESSGSYMPQTERWEQDLQEPLPTPDDVAEQMYRASDSYRPHTEIFGPMPSPNLDSDVIVAEQSTEKVSSSLSGAAPEVVLDDPGAPTTPWRWWLLLLVTVGLGVGGWLTLAGRDPTATVVVALAAETGLAHDLAWFPRGDRPRLKLPSARVERTRHLRWGPAQATLAELAEGWSLLTEPPLWVKRGREADITTAWRNSATATTLVAFQDRMRGQGIDTIGRAELAARLHTHNLEPLAANLLLRFLLEPVTTVAEPFQQRLRAGRLPESLEIAYLSGSNGQDLDRGTTVAYRLRLLRVASDDGPWRLLDVETSDHGTWQNRGPW